MNKQHLHAQTHTRTHTSLYTYLIIFPKSTRRAERTFRPRSFASDSQSQFNLRDLQPSLPCRGFRFEKERGNTTPDPTTTSDAIGRSHEACNKSRIAIRTKKKNTMKRLTSRKSASDSEDESPKEIIKYCNLRSRFEAE